METHGPRALAGARPTCNTEASGDTLPGMNLQLLSSGLILAAISLQGCAQHKHYRDASDTYGKLKAEISDYEPVGDPKIDGLAKPFVTGAAQLRRDFEKAKAEMDASPVTKHFGGLDESEYAKAYAALSPAEKKLVDDALQQAAKADKGKFDTLLKQLADLAVAGGRLTLEINDAAKGGAGGAAGLAASAGNLVSGPGKKAVAQVDEALRFGSAATKLIEQYTSLPGKVATAIDQNVRKAQA
jgi:hypothetical protein